MLAKLLMNMSVITLSLSSIMLILDSNPDKRDLYFKISLISCISGYTVFFIKEFNT